MIRGRKFCASAGVVLVAALAACGGGGGGSSVPSNVSGGSSASATPTPGVMATSTPVALASGQALAHFSITLPSSNTAATARKAQYVDPTTKSITMTLLTANGVAVSGATAQGPYNLQAGQTGCVTTSTTTCTFSIAAPIGTDVFVANTFSALGGVGPLGSGAVSIDVQANATNNASLTLTGPVANVTLASQNAQYYDTLANGNETYVPISQAIYDVTSSDSKARIASAVRKTLGLPTSLLSERIFVIATDANGNTILNPTTFNTNVILTMHSSGQPQSSMLTDVPPAGIGCTTTTATADTQFVQVCSPSDQITLSLIQPFVSSDYVYLYAGGYGVNGDFYIDFPYITASLATSPTVTLQTFPYTTEVAPPTPSPTPTGPTGGITVIGQ